LLVRPEIPIGCEYVVDEWISVLLVASVDKIYN
jgi:hypothetical protein